MRRLFVWHDGNENLVHGLEAYGIEHGEELPDDDKPIEHLVYLGGSMKRKERQQAQQIWNQRALSGTALSREWMLDSWQAYGMTTSMEQPIKPMDEILSCRLLVVHLKVVWQSRGWVEWPYEPRSRLQRLMRREAVKAVYALGLEIAEVKLALLGTDRYMIQSVSVTPFWQSSAVHALMEALQYQLPDLEDEDLLFSRRKIGADCELLLYSPKSGKVVSADRFLKKHGSIGCDGVLLRGNRMIYPLMEFRPLPADTPEGLIRNIKRVMQKAKWMIDDKYDWISGGMPFKGLPLGGHIHFSGFSFHSDMIRTLDNYVALPVMFMEHEADKERRPRYGYPGDFRLKSYGFEYRSLPSWLHDPTSALAVCTLAWLVMTHWRKLTARPLDDIQVLRGFMNGDRSACREAAILIWEQIKLLPDYERFRAILHRIEEAIIHDKRWTSGQDIRLSWNVTATDFHVEYDIMNP